MGLQCVQSENDWFFAHQVIVKRCSEQRRHRGADRCDRVYMENFKKPLIIMTGQPMVSLNKASLNPYFLGGGGTLGGVG